jgi:hypothetical protein
MIKKREEDDCRHGWTKNIGIANLEREMTLVRIDLGFPNRLGQLLGTYAPQECTNYFTHAGYGQT